MINLISLVDFITFKINTISNIVSNSVRSKSVKTVLNVFTMYNADTVRFIKPYGNPVNKYTGIPKGFMKWALNWIYLFYEICTFLDKNHKTFWQRIKCPQEIPNWSPDWDLLGKIKSFICERFSFIYFVDLNHHEAFVVVLNIKFLEPVNFIPFFLLDTHNNSFHRVFRMNYI